MSPQSSFLQSALTVEAGGHGVVDVDGNDLPVSLALIKEGHDTEDLDLLDLADGGDLLTDLDHINGIVITASLGLGVERVGVLPGLTREE